MMIHETTSETVRASAPLAGVHEDLADDSKRTGGNRPEKAERVAENGSEAVRPDNDSVKQAIAKAEEELSSMGVALKFNLNEDSDSIQVEVWDSNSEKVIRKIPADEVVRLSESIKDMAGVFMDKPA